MSYAILTDTSSNLPGRLLRQHKIEAVPFSYYVDETELTAPDCESFDGAAYYSMIEKGKHVRTSQISPQRFIDYMEPLLRKGRDILYIGMSSGISGAYASSRIAAYQLKEKYPDRHICVFDSRAASLGEGNLVLRAAQAMAEGIKISALVKKLHEWRDRTYQVFTVGDLMHLRRGGRLSNAAAILGTVLQIKPLLKGDKDGKIVAFQKVRGRRKAIAALAERYAALVEDAGEQTVGISHANAPEEAEELAGMLRQSSPPKDILTVMYEPVTGAHVGPGAVALFFLGGLDVRSR